MFHHSLCYRFCFADVAARPASIVSGIWQMMVYKAEIALFFVRAREDDQSVLVELMVGDGYKRLVAAAVVPTQHAFWRSLCSEQSENTLHISRQIVFINLVSIEKRVKETSRW